MNEKVTFELLCSIIGIIKEHAWGIFSVLFSGLGVTILFKKKNSENSESNETSIGNENVVSENGVSITGGHDVNIYNNINEKRNEKNLVDKKTMSLDDRKAKIHILFIDDQDFDIVKSIKKNEKWINTKRVKDITSLNSPDILWAHMIFVDVNGVGTSLYKNEQGLGLAKGIKEKYPNKKVVIYSSEKKHDAFSDVWDIVDGRLPKNADPIQFYTKIENLSETVEL